MRIVVVEDSLTVQQLIVERLESEAGLVIAGCAIGAAEAEQLVLQERPEVVLLDLHLGSDSGLKVLARLRETGFRGLIYILSADERAACGSLCIARGANGYYDKADLDALIADLTALKRVDASAPGR